MTDNRERAIEELVEATGSNPRIIKRFCEKQDNLGERGCKFAVEQGEQKLDLLDALKLIEHKADQALQGQYTKETLLGIILQSARAAIAKAERQG